MELITEPSEVPDERYHTLDIQTLETGDYMVEAKNNQTVARVVVESVGIGGESVGFEEGSARFGAAGAWVRVEYVDFTDEYGYEEVQVTFEDRE